MLVWRTAGDDKVCAACAALDGRPDGQGWSSLNGVETSLWQLDADDEYVRRQPALPALYGSPPLHPNCRCRVEEWPL
jgi:hypothetical protein